MRRHLVRSRGLAAASAIAICCAIAAPAAANSWFKVDPHAHSSNVSGDSAQDLGLIANAGKRLGFDAMFVTDHTASHVKEIGGVISNHLVLDDDLLQWPTSDYDAGAPPGAAAAGAGVPRSATAELVSAPVRSASRSLHLAATSTRYSERFVWTKRGPSLHAGDVILRFSAYPTRIGQTVSFALDARSTVSATSRLARARTARSS